MTEKSQQWRTAWKIDDPAWIKEREKEWRRINKQLKNEAFYFLKPAEVKILKSFFLTGFPPGDPPDFSEERLKDYYERPLYGVTACILFECWLSADQSEENFQVILGKYPGLEESTRYRFREMLANGFPAKGCLIDGLESRLYKLLEPTRCRRDIDYPTLSDKDFSQTCYRHFHECLPVIDRMLFAEPGAFNSCEVGNLMLPEFLDSYNCAYTDAIRQAEERNLKIALKEAKEERKKQAEQCRKIMDQPEQYDPGQIEMAKLILNGIAGMELHEDLAQLLAPYL